MKFLVPLLAAVVLAGCNSDLVRHEKDFSTKQRKGDWYDYHRGLHKSWPPEPKKELKDR
jgi:hypothetical protein